MISATLSLELIQLGILTALVGLSFADTVTIELEDGSLKGFTSVYNGKTINNFYAIPYAAPPVDTLRFLPPQPPIPWSDVRDATTPGHSCMQQDWDWNSGRQPSSEDCLFINVHAPSDVSEGSPLPVMVWVHGGSYRGGAGDLDDGSILAAKDVIVVTCNYRLDVFGYLSTEDELMPGNYGMLDQVAALKWVKDNIASFGGDPQKVTVFGESAGSTSVSLLVMSPLTKGLFRGAIMESGVSLCSWAYAHPARALSPGQAAEIIGDLVACPAGDDQLACFQSVDATKLLDAATEVSDLYFAGGILMNPRVELDYGFLPDLPSNLLTKGEYNHVNTIRGYNENEYSVYANFNIVQRTATVEYFLELVDYSLSEVIIEGKEELKDALVDYYLAGVASNDSLAIAQAIEKLGTDSSFLGAIINEIQLAFKSSEGELTYFYEFATKPEGSTQPDWITAGHAEEIPYVFGLVLNSTDPLQRNVSDTVMTMWTNFAKTGDPNSEDLTGDDNEIEWKPFGMTGSEDNMLSFRINGAVMTHFDEDGLAELYYDFLQRINTPIGPDNAAAGTILKFTKYRCFALCLIYTLLVKIASLICPLF